QTVGIAKRWLYDLYCAFVGTPRLSAEQLARCVHATYHVDRKSSRDKRRIPTQADLASLFPSVDLSLEAVRGYFTNGRVPFYPHLRLKNSTSVAAILGEDKASQFVQQQREQFGSHTSSCIPEQHHQKPSKFQLPKNIGQGLDIVQLPRNNAVLL